jgi:hypothetical protein
MEPNAKAPPSTEKVQTCASAGRGDTASAKSARPAKTPNLVVAFASN